MRCLEDTDGLKKINQDTIFLGLTEPPLCSPFRRWFITFKQECLCICFGQRSAQFDKLIIAGCLHATLQDMFISDVYMLEKD